MGVSFGGIVVLVQNNAIMTFINERMYRSNGLFYFLVLIGYIFVNFEVSDLI